MAVVVISSAEKGDRLDGSLEVKVPMAGKGRSLSMRGIDQLRRACRPSLQALFGRHELGWDAIRIAR